MNLNQKLILTGITLLLTTIAYTCMRIADSISGTAFPLHIVIFPSLIMAIWGIFNTRKK